MLVLTRKTGGRILIGDDVIITIVRISPGTVRVGIMAPERMNIRREDLAQKKGEKSELEIPENDASLGGI